MPRQTDDVKLLTQILALLQPMEPEARSRLLQTVFTFFGEEIRQPPPQIPAEILVPQSPQFAPAAAVRPNSEMTPKDFILSKRPTSQVQLVACLAYYLTHYRNKPDFKTIDITELGKEAGAQRMTNPAMTTQNASASGYLVPSSGGNKRLSAMGEQFVEALPDQAAANEVKNSVPATTRRRPKKKGKGKAKAKAGAAA